MRGWSVVALCCLLIGLLACSVTVVADMPDADRQQAMSVEVPNAVETPLMCPHAAASCGTHSQLIKTSGTKKVEPPLVCPDVVVTVPAEPDAVFVNCPFCGLLAIWTGQTQVIESRIWYIMKCVKGHRFFSPSAS